MARYKIEGGEKLRGNIKVHGAKNAALPILAACVINSGKSIIHNCPDLSDIRNTIEILELLGCRVSRLGDDVYVDSSCLTHCDIPRMILNKTRSSTIFAGALAARCGSSLIAGGGGCNIGKRPVDIHLDAFKSMGMLVNEENEFTRLTARDIKPGKVVLGFPSVGATENVMLAASRTPGQTTIYNAAMEPEIVNLADYLRSIGVRVYGDGGEVIVIHGTSKPTGGEVTVIPDRIVAATYIIAALASGGELMANNVNPSHISPVIAVLRRMGARIDISGSNIFAKCYGELYNIPYIKTAPYPGFPTDCQPMLTALMCVSRGDSLVRETVFEQRLGHCQRLAKFGADISTKGSIAYIRGKDRLYSASADACDLRSGAALCIAALAAEGTSYISNIHYIDRGYEDLCASLASLGAKAERIE